MRNIKEIILREITNRDHVSSEDIARICNISRQAAHLHLRDLVKAKKLLRIGKTRGSYYVVYSKEKAEELREEEKLYRRKLRNYKLEEDYVYDKISYTIPLLKKLQINTRDIIRYAFTEMLNNAIEHSGSRHIDILLAVADNNIRFDIIDRGIGIFKHIQKKFKLSDEYDALTELLKGKQTTFPSRHTGEGIFFTSKIADVFRIESSKIRLIIDNKQDDIYTEEIRYRKGTKVYFQINAKTRKDINALFGQYTDGNYKFHKTKVVVKLYQKGIHYTSRSQARRLIMGLDKFKVVILDFNQVKAIGQGFADEIFRVFKSNHPDIKVEAINCCKAAEFMIRRI